MATLDDATKARFEARRYMDDLLLLYKADDTWDHERFCEDIQTRCYMPPLKLEDSKDGTFLENTFRIEGGSLRFRLKNVNEGGKRNVWRYHDYDSYVAYGQKRATLIATLKKVATMAGDYSEMYESAMDKTMEFAQRGYPPGMRRYACQRVGRETGHRIWFGVAQEQLCM